jgi:multiple sugar transport system permease protein
MWMKPASLVHPWLPGNLMHRRRQIIMSFLTHVILLVVAALFVIPFIWLIISSLKVSTQIFTDPLQWIPHPIVWGNYVKALTTPAFPFLRLLRNTLFYAGTSTVGVVLSSSVVAYAFARMEFRGRDVLFAITLSTMMLPGIVTLIPTYILFNRIGWVGSYAPLIVPHFFGGAFNIFLLRQFMLTIPWDLTDAARVDGASDWTILWRVMLPLIKPALLVVALFHFLGAWNDFLGPLIYLSNPNLYTISLGLNYFKGEYATEFGPLMAVSALAVVPIIILFFFAQRTFIEGITLTGVKG